MNDQRPVIREKLPTSPGRLLTIWLLMFVIPVCASLLGLGYFVSEFSVYAEPEELSKAFNRLENYKEAMVFENYLFNTSDKLKQLQWQGNWHDKNSRAILKNKIDKIVGAQSIFCLLFDQTRSKFAATTFQPDDLEHKLIFPIALFKKQIQFLNSSIFYSMGQISENDNKERSKNALSMQQIFRTLTPVTLRKEKVVKNYSVLLGGELYFVYKEFAIPGGPAGCLCVYRGREINIPNLLNELKKEFPYCRVAIKKTNILQQYEAPENFFTGVSRHKNKGLIITQAAEQRFIRSYIMGGGTTLIKARHDRVPYVECEIPKHALDHQFTAWLPQIRLAGLLAILLSAIYFLHSVLFGENLARSFKQRMLSTTILASIFPFVFFFISFYFYTQFYQYVEKINLMQHMRLKMAQTNAELNQCISTIEVSIANFAAQFDQKKIANKDFVKARLQEIGKSIPVCELKLLQPASDYKISFPNRMSEAKLNITNAIIEYFPNRSLEILTELPPVERVQKDMVILAGHKIKSSSISDALLSDGAFFLIDQMRFHTWFSAVKIFVDNNSNQVAAILLGRFEAGSLLNFFLERSDLHKNNFTSDLNKQQIRFAFFPLEKTCSPAIWSGSGFYQDEEMKKVQQKSRSEFVTQTTADGKERITISRLNTGVPHLAVAMVEVNHHGLALFWRIVGLGSLVYLSLLFLLSSKLVDRIIVAPVLAIAGNAEQIARGKDTWQTKVASGDEFEDLNHKFSQMVKGLQQRNLLRDYVSSETLSDIETTQSASLLPGGEYRDATVLFASIQVPADLETLTPQQTIAQMNVFIGIAGDLISKYGGTIDKAIETTLMVVFRDNALDKQSHALQAVNTAFYLDEALKKAGYPGLFAGIASGQVISGRIGSYKGKLDFTVIGDPVNLAARLKKENESSDAGIIISGATMRLLKGKARVKFLKRCSLKGKAREYNIYELCDLR